MWWKSWRACQKSPMNGLKQEKGVCSYLWRSRCGSWLEKWTLQKSPEGGCYCSQKEIEPKVKIYSMHFSWLSFFRIGPQYSLFPLFRYLDLSRGNGPCQYLQCNTQLRTEGVGGLGKLTIHWPSSLTSKNQRSSIFLWPRDPFILWHQWDS